jgi:hypothetical protein
MTKFFYVNQRQSGILLRIHLANFFVEIIERLPATQIFCKKLTNNPNRWLAYHFAMGYHGKMFFPTKNHNWFQADNNVYGREAPPRPRRLPRPPTLPDVELVPQRVRPPAPAPIHAPTAPIYEILY